MRKIAGARREARTARSWGRRPTREWDKWLERAVSPRTIDSSAGRLVKITGSLGRRSMTSSATIGPLRLVAQDIGFSVREQGFDSPRGYIIKPCTARLYVFLGKVSLPTAQDFTGFHSKRPHGTGVGSHADAIERLAPEAIGQPSASSVAQFSGELGDP